jgi:glutamate-1-semialdehyde 2,1-aminomutase
METSKPQPTGELGIVHTSFPKSEAFSRSAAQYIAGGVVSLNRKAEPNIVFTHAIGSRLFDADGNEYIDYHAAFSPHLLGHNHPVINEAVRKAMDEEWSLMGSGVTPWEARLAKLLCEAIPSVERVQITNTGSEATAHAITLSRAWTGRDHIILMLGGYNGWHNDVARTVMPALEAIGPRLSPGEYPFLPLSAGIPKATTRRLHVVNYNDVESVEHVMRQYPIACVLTEPVLQNIGVVPPREGYLELLRKVCDQNGALLVFDEVKTGFRSALGGYQSIAGVAPDLSVFGKAVANGYPLAVIGGRREIMDLFADPDPSRRVLIAGTYNAHPIGAAAAIATLEILLKGGVYEHLEALGSRLQGRLEDLFAEKGIAATVSRIGSAFCVYFCDHVPTDWHDILAHHDFELDRRYRRRLIERGVYNFPLPCKQGSVSAAHTDEDISRTLEITHDVLQRI